MSSFVFQLQEAFAAGLIKPGLNTLFEQKKKRVAINDKAALEQKLKELKPKDKSLNSWIERLDMINKPAPLAPELAMKVRLRLKICCLLEKFVC